MQVELWEGNGKRERERRRLKRRKGEAIEGCFCMVRERERERGLKRWDSGQRASFNKRWEKGVPENIGEVRGVKL